MISDRFAAYKARQFIDSQIERFEAIIASKDHTKIPEDSIRFLEGQIHALRVVKVNYFLTELEEAESGKMRQEMFG